MKLILNTYDNQQAFMLLSFISNLNTLEGHLVDVATVSAENMCSILDYYKVVDVDAPATWLSNLEIGRMLIEKQLQQRKLKSSDSLLQYRRDGFTFSIFRNRLTIQNSNGDMFVLRGN